MELLPKIYKRKNEREEKQMGEFNRQDEFQKRSIIFNAISNKRLDEKYRNKEDITDMIRFTSWYFEKVFGIKVDIAEVFAESEGMFEKWEIHSKHRRLEPEQVVKIQKYIKMGYSFAEISRRLGVTRRTVSRIAGLMDKG